MAIKPQYFLNLIVQWILYCGHIISSAGYTHHKKPVLITRLVLCGGSTNPHPGAARHPAATGQMFCPVSKSDKRSYLSTAGKH